MRCNRAQGASRIGLAALDNYDVLDTSSEEAFDRVTRLVRNIFGVSMLRRVLKAGQITFNGGRSTIECTIRGLSKNGAESASRLCGLGPPKPRG